MRFATVELAGRAQPVVVSPDGRGFVPASTIIPGFTGDLIARVPSPPQEFGRLAGWQSLAGHRLPAKRSGDGGIRYASRHGETWVEMQ